MALAPSLMFGIETEYAFSALGDGIGPDERAGVLNAFLALARRELPHLRDAHAPGLFLANGSRLYIDCGAHPELCTPECTDPRELVRYLEAGDRILALLIEKFERSQPGMRVAIYRCNVDYASSSGSTTWGCHESYLHRADPGLLPPLLIPHLVSRILYTGAGGFDNRSRARAFLLSPRVPHLARVVSQDSTMVRGIFHTKNEPLCGGGFSRLHLLCGESLASQLGNYLKVGATALVVRLIEAGALERTDFELRAPREAMRRFARDLAGRGRARLLSGRMLSALDLQRRYLAAAIAHGDASFMPDWAPELCRVWSDTLDRVEAGPEAVATRLDWAIKLALYQRRVRGGGGVWRTAGLPRAISDPLCELDLRFGELGPAGVFRSLDARGVLDHGVPGVEPIDPALSLPPAHGRARARGRLVGELASAGRRYACTWQAIYDTEEERTLTMFDPFEEEPSWTAGRPRRREIAF